jgi:hypothetical protein
MFEFFIFDNIGLVELQAMKGETLPGTAVIADFS